MQFQSYKIADLIPASYNPRKKLKPGDKEYEKIKNSIKEFGYVEPIIIRKYVIMQNSTNWCLLHGIMDSMVTMAFV